MMLMFYLIVYGWKNVLTHFLGAHKDQRAISNWKMKCNFTAEIKSVNLQNEGLNPTVRPLREVVPRSGSLITVVRPKFHPLCFAGLWPGVSGWVQRSPFKNKLVQGSSSSSHHSAKRCQQPDIVFQDLIHSLFSSLLSGVFFVCLCFFQLHLLRLWLNTCF